MVRDCDGIKGVKTYSSFVERPTAQRIINLILPTPIYARQDILLRDILRLGDIIVLRIVRVNDADDFVLGAAEPAFFEVLEDDFYARFGAGYVACVGYGDAEGA